MIEPTPEHVREILRSALGLTSESDLSMQQELLSEHLHNHWVEGPGAAVTVPKWGTHPSWELSYVGRGGGYSIVHVALASARIDALVVLAAERLLELNEEVPDALIVLANDLLLCGRARIYRGEGCG